MRSLSPNRWGLLLLAAVVAAASCDAESTSTGDGVGGGEELLCNPGETRSCYEGPEDTDGVGECSAGVEACLQHGRGWGPCVGQVLPAQEDCDLGADENCDGLTSCGQTIWANRLGGDSHELAFRIDSDAAGNIYIAGVFRQPIDLGGGELPTTDGSLDAFIAKFDGDGEHVWSTSIHGAGNMQTRDIAVSDDGDDVVFVANAVGDVEFDGTTLTANGNNDLLIIKVDGDGQTQWTRRLGDDGPQTPTAVALDAAGNILITGTFSGTFDFGVSEPLTSAGFGSDIFVVKLDESGTELWSRGYNAPLEQVSRGATFDANGRAYFTGRISGRIDFGGGELTATGETSDIFLVALDESGEHVFSRSWGGDGFDEAWAVAADADGNATITGRFEQTVRFGESLLDAVGAGAIFVTRVDAAGNDVWTERIGGSSDQFGSDLVLDSRNRVVVTGYYEGDVRFGEAKLPLSGLGEPNILVAKLEPDGAPVWARGIAVDGNQDTGGVGRGWRSVAMLPGDFIALGGFVQRVIDFGDGELEDFGGADLLIAKLAP